MLTNTPELLLAEYLPPDRRRPILVELRFEEGKLGRISFRFE